MKLVVKVVFSIVISAIFAIAVSGVLIWLATVRHEDFYLRSGFRSGAIASFWVKPLAQRDAEHSQLMSQFSISMWLNPKRSQRAFAHFDQWIQEYILIRNETAEAADDETHVLPSVPLPSQEEEEDRLVRHERDPYDVALSSFLHDVWDSGFLTIAGSTHFQIPFWAKPLSGLTVAFAQTQIFDSVFDAFLNHLSLRPDGFDVPSWLNSIPLAHTNNASSQSLIHEVVLEIGGRELNDLLIRLCELRNLSEAYCSADEDEENPLQPLLYVSDDFQVQFNLYWALRGQHLIWSNSAPCLISLIEQPVSSDVACGDDNEIQKQLSKESSTSDFVNFKNIARRAVHPAAGIWMNQQALKRSFSESVRQLHEHRVEGASWVEDFFNSSGGERFNAEWNLALARWAHEWPIWGSEVEYRGTDVGALLTYGKHSSKPDLQESPPPLVVRQQFDLLNSLMSAWMGLPHPTGRLAESKPWESVQAHWRSESLYRLGWSEQE